MARAKSDPMTKILEAYRDLPNVEAREAVMCAMKVFSGAPVAPKPSRKAAQKPQPTLVNQPV